MSEARSTPTQSLHSAATEGFRPDINGLRAWAVLVVILFHFNISGFAGGYIGVDMFFVISGFLMTGIVVRGLERKSDQGFSLITFFVARARRIVPALLVMCAILLVIGWWTLPSLDYKTSRYTQVSRAHRAMRVEFQPPREPDRGHAKLF